ncbi:BspA family leucine-rich repeat surface protein [Polaribacter litorisediminis]|uniref:BspA family leucine-rich repeat surface protein n=1 Tax=Polaribacter litorisediminis TaxID=1908341 RepID=UPI001CBEEB7F|nr:BspA family leucine-rich repeat surface protein [Polaribacter litorisediminis]UAM97877.1 BspA family leucine-rich repeat surface protein [Polaribacter litorisediminis]
MQKKLLTLIFTFSILLSFGQNEFITKWRTNLGVQTITIPTIGSGYNYTVDWGDGTIENGFTGDATHNYGVAGEFIVSITGDFPRIYFKPSSSAVNNTLVEIMQWGSNTWTSMEDAFNSCISLEITATDSPNLNNVTSLKSMFNSCIALTGNSSINDWDVSTIQNFEEMFRSADNFNAPLNNWDVGAALNMKGMFFRTKEFNQNLNSWDVSKVENMDAMFSQTDSFNGDITSWDIGSVTNVSSMFSDSSFNQDISSWGVGHLTNMTSMFSDSSFNQDISSWDVSNVTDMTSMFSGSSFNQDISSWNVSSVTNMSFMFAYGSFNQDISSWNFGNVTNMSSMFEGDDSFKQDMSAWDVSNVTNMSFMFAFGSFNQDISSWDVGKVTNMEAMFRSNSQFNQDISSWNVSSVNSMRSMFRGADRFDQNIGTWDVSNVTDMALMFLSFEGGLSSRNYDLILQGWSNLPNLSQNVSINADYISYCNAEAARTKLINDYNWNISDAGKDCSGEAFITKWKTTTANESITIPTTGAGYNYTVDWGDGTIENGFTGNATHSYTIAGEYEVSITGDFPRIYFNNAGSKFKIIDIVQWGSNPWVSMFAAFQNCPNLIVSAIDTPNLENVTDMGYMFYAATSLNQDLSSWDVSNVTYMSSMFTEATSFNQDLSSWDVSNVTDMLGMFFSSGFDVNNYDKALIAWSNLPTLKQNVSFGAQGVSYCNGEAARTKLINDYNWNITDEGKDCSDVYISIPDTNFEQALIDLGYDTNGLNGNILTSDAVAVTSLSLPSAISAAITDLTGIEGFTQLTSLTIVGSKITSIDVSKNVNLLSLSLADNSALTALDVSKNEDLRSLNIGLTDLRSSGKIGLISVLDVSNNINLVSINARAQSLTSLDISNNVALESLDLEKNNITSLDVSNNTKLYRLDVTQTNLTTLDVSNLADLGELYAPFNSLISLDVSNNLKLARLDCNSNNTITTISLGNNDVLSYLNISGNLLTTLDTSQNNGLLDLECGFNNLTSLIVNDELKTLSCDDNNLTSLDVTNATNLEELRCTENSFSALDVTKNTKLTGIHADYNSLTSIDLSKNTNLETLGISNNALTTLEISNNTKLESLDCSANNLTDIDFGTNINLGSISAYENALATIDVSKLTNLTRLSAYNNSLTSLDLSENLLLERLDVSNNHIDSLNLSLNNSLLTLDVRDNSLEYLNVKNGNNMNMIIQGTYALDVAGNPNLTCIQVDDIAYANANFNKDATASFNLGCGVNTAATNGNWSDPSSWSTGVVPTSNDNVTIPAGTTLQIGSNISEINSLVNEGSIVIGPTFSLKSNTTLVNNGSIVMDSESNNSSVLFVQGASSGTITYKRGGLKANAWSLVAPPVSGQKIEEFALNADNDIRINTSVSPNRYAIAYHDDTAIEGEKWKYYTTDIASSLTFTAGESYSMSRGTDGSVSFTGTLTTADVSKSLNAGAWSAIGNPFTTYYPANKNSENSFLNQNFAALDDEFKAVYLWSTTQNKFVSVTEIDINNRSLTPGQGFLIKLKPSATSVQFNEDKRTLKPNDATNTFAKNNDLYAELALENDNYNVTTAIKFYPNATLGFDVGYDIRNFDGASFDVFTHLADQSSENNFSIQSVPSTDMENTIVPLGVNLPNEEKVKFTLSAVNLPEGIHVVIEDRMLNTFNNMSTDNTYVPDFSQNKNLKDRFFVHFKTASALSTNTPTLNEINIFVKERVLFVEGIKNEKALKVFNMLGQELLTVNLEADSNQINLPNHIKSGIYLISIKADTQTHTQRILLK